MRKEASIQRHLLIYLKTTPSLGKIRIAANFNEFARHQKDMGMDVGSPDLRLETIHNGITHILYLELKIKKGKLNPEQIKWNEDFDANWKSKNCQRAVAYGYNEAQKIISDWVLTTTAN